MTAAASAQAITRVLDAMMREDRGRLLSALIARLGDFQRAEDALQEAMASALVHWGRNGLPNAPKAWLLQVAWRKALDRIRKNKTDQRKVDDLAMLAEDIAGEAEAEDIPDERLRLIFTCCHPALESKSRVALTLRVIAGLSTAEIARAFLDAEPTMGQRLSRAKAKIAAAGIAYQMPGPEDWPERLNSVLTVIYLIFNAGYTVGPISGRDLCDEAIYLAGMVDQLRPAEAEAEGALALLLITHARRRARVDGQGGGVVLADQDRALWDHPMLAKGRAVLDRALARRSVGPFQIKAAISSLHSTAEGPPDWPQIRALYDLLVRMEPTPVVWLNRAVALAETGAVAQALDDVLRHADALADYQPFYAVSADLLARLNRCEESRSAYDRAIALAPSSADAEFLIRKRDSSPKP